MTQKYSIVIVEGPGKGEVISFSHDIVHIGRTEAENELTFNDPSISGRHARLVHEAGQFFLQDLRSSNGTYYNGARLEGDVKEELQYGDQFSLGRIVLALTEYIELDSVPVEQAAPEAGRKKLIATVSEKIPIPPAIQALLQRKPVRLALIGLAVLFVLLLIMKIFSGPSVKEVKALSAVPVPLPAEGLYGYMTPNLLTRPDKAVFSFAGETKKVELYYTAGGVDPEGEVVIHLNGTNIGNVPLAKGWGEEQVLILPKSQIKAGEENLLVFDNILLLIREYF